MVEIITEKIYVKYLANAQAIVNLLAIATKRVTVQAKQI